MHGLVALCGMVCCMEQYIQLACLLASWLAGLPSFLRVGLNVKTYSHMKALYCHTFQH